MKSYALALTLTFLSAYCFAISDTTLKFTDLTYSQIFEQARKDKKPIMLYFHFDGCGACVKMEKEVFNKTAVFEYYNKQFTLYSINILKGEGKEINKQYNVQLCPTFLFVNADGITYHKAVGFLPENEFLEHGKKGSSGKATLSLMKQEYKKGNRKKKFLFDYIYLLRDSYELDSLTVNQYVNQLTEEEMQEPKNLKLIYEFAVHQFKVFLPLESKGFSALIRHKDKLQRQFDADQVLVRIKWIAFATMRKAAEINNKSLLLKAFDIADKHTSTKTLYFKELDGRVTGSMKPDNGHELTWLYFYSKNGPLQEYKDYLKKYSETIWNNSGKLNSLVYNMYMMEERKELLLLLEPLIIQSVELRRSYYNMDTYATLLYKLEKYTAAKKIAEEAIELAKEKGISYAETTKLLEEIKKKLPE
jgi:thioredoxin-related protein